MQARHLWGLHHDKRKPRIRTTFSKNLQNFNKVQQIQSIHHKQFRKEDALFSESGTPQSHFWRAPATSLASLLAGFSFLLMQPDTHVLNSGFALYTCIVKSWLPKVLIPFVDVCHVLICFTHARDLKFLGSVTSQGTHLWPSPQRYRDSGLSKDIYSLKGKNIIWHYKNIIGIKLHILQISTHIYKYDMLECTVQDLGASRARSTSRPQSGALLDLKIQFQPAQQDIWVCKWLQMS